MVIGIGVLLCAIPLLVFFFLRAPNDEFDKPNDFESFEKSAHPPTAWPLEQTDEHYRITLSPISHTLKLGNQSLKLRIEPLSEQPAVTLNPKVNILMPMGVDTLKASTKILPLKLAGRYQLQTQFDTAGTWELDVKPDLKSAPLKFYFQVEL